MNGLLRLAAVGDNQVMIPIIIAIIAIALVVLLIALVAMIRKRNK